MLAALTSVKELSLSEEEARNMADAAKAVAKHYSFFLSEKQLAWWNLGCVGTGIYGPRFVAWGVRRGSERKAKAPAPAPAAPGGAAPPVNGHAAAQPRDIDLTPPFMTAPPVNEEIP